MIKKLKGRPSEFDSKIIERILKAIPEDDGTIQLNDLQKITDLNRGTLIKYLNYLTETGVIDKIQSKRRGRPFDYRLSTGFYPGWHKHIKRIRDKLKNNTNSAAVHNLKNNPEYIQAFYLLELINIINITILNVLKQYTESELGKKKTNLETNLKIINMMVKEMIEVLSEHVGMTKFTYNITRLALEYTEFINILDEGIIRTANGMGLVKDENENIKSLGYSFDELKKKFSTDQIEEEIKKSKIANKKIQYLFSWDSVPGNDNERLIKYLKDNFNLDLVENVELNKSDDGKAISISNDGNTVEIMIDDKKEKATLKITEITYRELKVKIENGMLNLYDRLP